MLIVKEEKDDAEISRVTRHKRRRVTTIITKKNDKLATYKGIIKSPQNWEKVWRVERYEADKETQTFRLTTQYVKCERVYRHQLVWEG